MRKLELTRDNLVFCCFCAQSRWVLYNWSPNVNNQVMDPSHNGSIEVKKWFLTLSFFDHQKVLQTWLLFIYLLFKWWWAITKKAQMEIKKSQQTVSMCLEEEETSKQAINNMVSGLEIPPTSGSPFQLHQVFMFCAVTDMLLFTSLLQWESLTDGCVFFSFISEVLAQSLGSRSDVSLAPCGLRSQQRSRAAHRGR